MNARTAYTIAYALRREEASLRTLAQDLPPNTLAFLTMKRAIVRVRDRSASLRQTAHKHGVTAAVDCATHSHRQSKAVPW